MIKIEISSSSIDERNYERFDAFFTQKVEELTQEQLTAIICIINQCPVNFTVKKAGFNHETLPENRI